MMMLEMKRILGILSVIILLFVTKCSSQRGEDYPLQLQLEIDALDISWYFRNERLIKLQLKCLFYNGPCDIVGRWLKPRMIPGVFGSCPKCTEFQAQNLAKWLNTFADRFPILFRTVIAQWLLDNGYNVPDIEVTRIQRAMGFPETTIITDPYGDKMKQGKAYPTLRTTTRPPLFASFFDRVRNQRRRST